MCRVQTQAGKNGCQAWFILVGEVGPFHRVCVFRFSSPSFDIFALETWVQGQKVESLLECTYFTMELSTVEQDVQLT